VADVGGEATAETAAVVADDPQIDADPDETRFDLPAIPVSPGPDETRFDLPAIPASPGPDETRSDRVAEPKAVPGVPVASKNGGVRLPPAPDATTVAVSIQPPETERTPQTDSIAGEQSPEASTARISKVGGRPYLGPGNLGPRFDDTRPDLIDTIHTPILRIARDNGSTAPNRPASAATVPPPAAKIGTDSRQPAEADGDFPLTVKADPADPPSSADVTGAPPKATPPPTVLSPQAEQAPAPEASTPEALAPEASTPQTLAPQTLAPQTLAPQTPGPQSAAPPTAAPPTPRPQSPAPQARSRLLSRRRPRTDSSNGPSAGTPAPSEADSSVADSGAAAPSPPVADAADAAGSKKSRGGYFGLAPSVRPDVITDAETIMLPALEKNRTKSGSRSGPGTSDGHAQQSSGPMPALAFARPPEAATQIMPVLEAPLLVAPAPTRPSTRAGASAAGLTCRNGTSRTVIPNV